MCEEKFDLVGLNGARYQKRKRKEKACLIYLEIKAAAHCCANVLFLTGGAERLSVRREIRGWSRDKQEIAAVSD